MRPPCLICLSTTVVVVGPKFEVDTKSGSDVLNVKFDTRVALVVLRRDPVDSVVQRSAKIYGVVESKTDPFKGITVEELKARWKATVDQLLKKDIIVTNPDHALEGALCIRYVATLKHIQDTLKSVLVLN